MGSSCNLGEGLLEEYEGDHKDGERNEEGKALRDNIDLN